ncbi:hypothetical protein PI124_g11960 [Phytophthora idaei]|nr:hypothetical protein PI125_g11757 [Phytophthora idaei]KAG3152504.1 hypothetical protein PI126_g10478 [Phytophthora idaei]KAG3243213.1 hypothetical protein PI124_g11960 [Phytophthora idaei]
MLSAPAESVDIDAFIDSYLSESKFWVGLATADADSLRAACFRRGINIEGFYERDEYIEALWWSRLETLEQQLPSASKLSHLFQDQRTHQKKLFQHQCDEQTLLFQHEFNQLQSFFQTHQLFPEQQQRYLHHLQQRQLENQQQSRELQLTSHQTLLHQQQQHLVNTKLLEMGHYHQNQSVAVSQNESNAVMARHGFPLPNFVPTTISLDYNASLQHLWALREPFVVSTANESWFCVPDSTPTSRLEYGQAINSRTQVVVDTGNEA